VAQAEPYQTADAPAPVAPVDPGLGNTGVVLMAILAGVVAWLLSSFIKI
jgi:hypothetical protein